MTETIKEKVERYRLLSEYYLEKDLQIALWDIDGEYYFADILLVGEDTLTLEAFSPKSKIGKHYIPYLKIARLMQYEKKVDGQ